MGLFSRRPSRADFDREALPHLAALHGAAMRMTRSESDAEDLVQETIMRAYRFFDSFEPGTNCKAWLFRILNNTFCNRYRQRDREREILSQAESSDANLGQFLGDLSRDSETALLGRMVSEDVERALAAVPSDFRMAVILADLEDFSYNEIADIMGCPAGTVMSRLFRGRKMLQKSLFQYAVDQGVIPAPASAPAGEAPIDLATFRKSRSKSGAQS